MNRALLHYYGWMVAMALAVVMMFFFIYRFFDYYTTEADRAFGRGTRVVVDIETARASYKPVLPEDEWRAMKDRAEAEKRAASEDYVPEKVVEEVVVEKEHGKISIIVTGLGLSSRIVQTAQALDPRVAFSFSPYTHDLGEVVARIKGRELLLDIPLQYEDFPDSDAGKYALDANQPVDENIANLGKILELMPAASGYLFAENTNFLAEADQLASLLPLFRKHPAKYTLFNYQPEHSEQETQSFYANANTQEEEVAAPFNVQLANANLKFLPKLYFADASLGSDVVEHALEMLEKQIAETEGGYAVLAVYPYPAAIDVIQAWLTELKNKPLDLVTPSALIADVYRKQEAEAQAKAEAEEVARPVPAVVPAAPVEDAMPPSENPHQEGEAAPEQEDDTLPADPTSSSLAPLVAPMEEAREVMEGMTADEQAAAPDQLEALLEDIDALLVEWERKDQGILPPSDGMEEEVSQEVSHESEAQE